MIRRFALIALVMLLGSSTLYADRSWHQDVRVSPCVLNLINKGLPASWVTLICLVAPGPPAQTQ